MTDPQEMTDEQLALETKRQHEVASEGWKLASTLVAEHRRRSEATVRGLTDEQLYDKMTRDVAPPYDVDPYVWKTMLDDELKRRTRERKNQSRQEARPQFKKMTTEELLAFADDYDGWSKAEIAAAVLELNVRIRRMKAAVKKLRLANDTADVRLVAPNPRLLVGG